MIHSDDCSSTNPLSRKLKKNAKHARNAFNKAASNFVKHSCNRNLHKLIFKQSTGTTTFPKIEN